MPFISFSCLNELAKTSSTVCFIVFCFLGDIFDTQHGVSLRHSTYWFDTSSGESSYLALSPNLEGKLSSLIIKCDVNCRNIADGFCQVEEVPL